MTSSSELDRVIVDELQRGIHDAHAPHTTSTVPARAERRRGLKPMKIVAAGCGLVAAAAIVAAVAMQPTQQAIDPTAPSSPSTPPASSAPPCKGEWSDLIDVSQVPTYPTPEAAVRARIDDDWAVSVNGKDSGGSTVVEVTDPWGRAGVYQTSQYEGRWFVHSGSGCAP